MDGVVDEERRTGGGRAGFGDKADGERKGRRVDLGPAHKLRLDDQGWLDLSLVNLARSQSLVLLSCISTIPTCKPLISIVPLLDLYWGETPFPSLSFLRET